MALVVYFALLVLPPIVAMVPRQGTRPKLDWETPMLPHRSATSRRVARRGQSTQDFGTTLLSCYGVDFEFLKRLNCFSVIVIALKV